jgi:hypothetical protein
MSAECFCKLLSAVVGAALESGLHPSQVHSALAVAGMELDDQRVVEPDYPDDAEAEAPFGPCPPSSPSPRSPVWWPGDVPFSGQARADAGFVDRLAGVGVAVHSN